MPVLDSQTASGEHGVLDEGERPVKQVREVSTFGGRGTWLW